MGWIILLVIVVVLIIALIFYMVRIVPQTEEYVIEFLGKYQTTWSAGIHFLIPIVQRVASRASFKEQCADFEPQNVITKDNPLFALENLSATTLRNKIGEMNLDEVLTSRDAINENLKQILDEATDPWGINVTRVELKNIEPPLEIKNAMEKQMKAEREKRATILDAEAHQESVVKKAEGDALALVKAAEAQRDAEIAKAEGKAEAIRKIYEAEAQGLERLKEAAIDKGVLSLKALEALKELGDGQATKLIVPTDLTKTVSDLSVVAEILDLPKDKK